MRHFTHERLYMNESLWLRPCDTAWIDMTVCHTFLSLMSGSTSTTNKFCIYDWFNEFCKGRMRNRRFAHQQKEKLEIKIPLCKFTCIFLLSPGSLTDQEIHQEIPIYWTPFAGELVTNNNNQILSQMDILQNQSSCQSQWPLHQTWACPSVRSRERDTKHIADCWPTHKSSSRIRACRNLTPKFSESRKYLACRRNSTKNFPGPKNIQNRRFRTTIDVPMYPYLRLSGHYPTHTRSMVRFQWGQRPSIVARPGSGSGKKISKHLCLHHHCRAPLAAADILFWKKGRSAESCVLKKVVVRWAWRGPASRSHSAS